jgi:pimeloyl-ACP methyl ester carboxylesterase
MKARNAALTAAGVAGGAGVLYVLQRAAAARWRVGAEELAAAGLTLPGDLRHHFLTTSDGGRIHVVERGERGERSDGAAVGEEGAVGAEGAAGGQCPTYVLVHGIMLGIAAWAPQLRSLDGRVLAVSQRGHGQSRAGGEGYAFERLASDLLEVLEQLDVHDAVLVGHSMGGMIAQLAAVSRPAELARHARRLVLVSTSPGGGVVSPYAAFAGPAAARALAGAERRGRGPLPKSATVWGARLSFGASPSPADVELMRGMLDAMSPGALAQLVPHLFTFDVRDRLGTVELPVHVVVGSRDVLTPPRTARAIVEHLPAAGLSVLPGCGHMVMLERPEALGDLLAG